MKCRYLDNTGGFCPRKCSRFWDWSERHKVGNWKIFPVSSTPPPPPADPPRALAAAKLNFNYNYTRPEHSAEEFFVSEDNELQLITFLINNNCVFCCCPAKQTNNCKPNTGKSQFQMDNVVVLLNLVGDNLKWDRCRVHQRQSGQRYKELSLWKHYKAKLGFKEPLSYQTVVRPVEGGWVMSRRCLPPTPGGGGLARGGSAAIRQRRNVFIFIS